MIQTQTPKESTMNTYDAPILFDNRTPHPVIVIAADGTVALTIPPSGRVARLGENHEVRASIPTVGGDVPLVAVQRDGVADLPERQIGTLVVVSQAVAQAVNARDDLVFPYPLAKDAAGRVVGCGGFGTAFTGPIFADMPPWAGPVRLRPREEWTAAEEAEYLALGG